MTIDVTDLEARHKELVTRHQQTTTTLQMLEEQVLFTRRQIHQLEGAKAVLESLITPPEMPEMGQKSEPA